MQLQKIRIGDFLIKKGLLSEAQLKVALSEQKKLGKKLGQVLIDLGYIEEDVLLKVIAEQLKVEIISADDIEFTNDLKKIIPENIARRLNIIPIKATEDTIHIATNDPTNIFAIDEIMRITGKDIKVYIISNNDLLVAFERIYGSEDRLFKIAEDVEKKILAMGNDEKFFESLGEDMPVVNLVDGIVARAVAQKASDIHIEPDEDTLRIRYRVDGLLHEVLKLNKILHLAIVSRIKIMSDMNIAEKRSPQDGRFKMKINFKDVDFRVSTLPTNYGEKVVLRVLDRDKGMLDLNRIGMDHYNLELYNEIIKKPYGIILISGPTGSGKTTTLYASLNKLNSIDKNIVTVEDPIEYNFKLINQVQVDESANVTFASALRSILRQDPDIIMVGEIRDKETAEIAIQASLTGHLVLSTIHTNDAVSSITRLLDMGIEPFLVSTSIIGLVGQRLVRKVCLNCAEEYEPEKELLERIGYTNNETIKFVRGKGCQECHYTGYSGRIGIYEVLKTDSKIREFINKNASIDTIKQYAMENGFHTMYKSGMALAKAGITTLEEVLRVTVISEE
jgi:type IV pilus assembly protein PilB